jgi:hypothetical protein
MLPLLAGAVKGAIARPHAACSKRDWALPCNRSRSTRPGKRPVGQRQCVTCLAVRAAAEARSAVLHRLYGSWGSISFWSLNDHVGW